MAYNLAPQSLGVATMLYGSAMAQEHKHGNMEVPVKGAIGVVHKVIGKVKESKPPASMIVGDLRQSIGIVSQKASAEMLGAMPGNATQNHIVNQTVSAVGKITGAMTVPGL